MNLDLLAFGAHPDDVELSCGGTIIKLVKAGYSVGVIDLTEAELSTRGTVENRRIETAKAGEIMGIKVRENLQIPDGHIDNVEKNRLKVINSIRKYKPKIVFAPYTDDRHPDHVHASKLIIESAFYSGLVKIESEFPAHRPEKIIHYFQHLVDKPSFVVDISNEFVQKMETVKAFASQFYNPESDEPETLISRKNFMQMLEDRARYFGYQVGVEYAEPFFIKSMIKIDNIYEFFS
ncbi:MAG: bacillithiol biosynthesis deacetylase BshB1 [Calditrichaceae bacterium]|jgi:N-acetylglucosamine malate deacetylase 1